MTQIGFQKLFGHPLILESHLHGKHPCPMCLIGRKKWGKKNPKGMTNTLILSKSNKNSYKKENQKAN